MTTTSQQAHHPSDIDQSSQKENLPLCAKFNLRTFKRCVKYSAGIIMDNHLVVLAQDDSRQMSNLAAIDFIDGYNLKDDEPAILLAFNLQDHTVQEVEMDSETFGYKQSYLLKYGENQIIKYSDPNTMSEITVESFEPFEVKTEDLYGQMGKKLFHQTAQIYQDCMYVYAKAQDVDELWSFDLKNQTWKLCETTGEAPPSLMKTPKSFIFEDNLYVYGGWKTKFPLGEIFMLNLNSMKWTKIELEGKETGNEDGNVGTVYKHHLVALEKHINSEENVLHFLRAKNKWSGYNIKGLGDGNRYTRAITGGSMSYKNWILNLVTEGHDRHLIVTMMNIENYGNYLEKSGEEEGGQSGLFLSENESDIAFKIEEQVIPAHKEILMKKSKYFESLFNSGMAESTQEIIEIKDCEYEIFREYLRWLYQGTVNLCDADQAIKLHILADKYLQEDLHEKCLDILILIII